MKEQVQSALDDIRPSLQADGGDVELVVEGGVLLEQESLDVTDDPQTGY